MAVNNSLPVKLTDVVAEFGGGASAPKNLGAYRAGAGYTPLGAKGGSAAIPTPNGAIPSSLPLNLGSFPGAKRELTVTQYWPYKGSYHRTYNYWQSSPPQTGVNNTDPTGGWDNINGSNAKYMNNQVLWQQKKFTGNNSNASLPDSGQCTVVYLVNNGSFSNVMSQGTGLSVRAIDPQGVIQHMTPIATGKYNFVTQGGSGTESLLAMSYASYNCSMKKITDVFTAMTDGPYAGTWDMLIILPGLKKVKEAPVTRDDTGYDIKPSQQIQVDDVVFGMRYDGAGNYQIQYNNQTFPNWWRSANWWYNNGAFDMEANCGTGPQTLTTTVPQDASPCHVWIVMNEQTGAVLAQGVNPIWNSLSLAVSYVSSSTLTIKRNGGISATIGSANYDYPTYANTPENWYVGMTMNNMPGDGYWVQVTANGTSNAPSGPTGWVPLTSDQTWSWTGNGTSCIADIKIADNAAGNNPKYLGYAVMGVVQSSGGGGGGCVEVTSYLPSGARANEMAVGSPMELADPVTLEPALGTVTYSETKVQPGYRIETESGISLRCSDTAPIPVEGGGYKTPSELLGFNVATRHGRHPFSPTQWEKVVKVESIGDIAVQHITVGDRNFWAGEQEDGFILHHNLKNQDNYENAAN